MIPIRTKLAKRGQSLGPRLRALISFAFAVCMAAPVAGGCATYSDHTLGVREALVRGDLEASEKELNEFLKVRSSEKLPSKWKKNYGLVILERATVLQARREYELSARDYEVADKQLELLDIARDGAGKIGRYIYSDSATKYKTSPTEKLSLNAMNMVNYLARGDLEGAKVEARRFTVMRKYLEDYDPENVHGAFGSYLAGYVFERLGNPDEALRYYEEALQARDFSSLREVIPRLAGQGSFRAQRIEDYLPSAEAPTTAVPAVPETSPETPSQDPRPYAKPVPKSGSPDATDKGPPAEAPPVDGGEKDAPEEPSDAPPVQRPGPPSPVSEAGGAADSSVAVEVLGAVPASGARMAEPATAGEILVLAKVGRVPHKEPRRIPIGAAIGIAGAFVTGDTTLLEYGMFKVVVYPELVASHNLFDRASLTVDGHAVQLDLATDLRREIIEEYEDIKPRIIGAALTRMIVRAAAAEGARAAGRQSEGAGGLVGFLAAAAVEGTLVALDKPDTRSWTTLPAKVYVGRTRLPPGKHRLDVTVTGSGGTEVRTIDVDVPPGGFVVVDVTTLR